MDTMFQARWITKPRRDYLKRNGRLGRAVLLDSLNGCLLIEPVGSDLGDGPVLPREEAEYELRDVWCIESRTKLADARALLQLEPVEVPMYVADQG